MTAIPASSVAVRTMADPDLYARLMQKGACRLCDLANDDRCIDAPCLSDSRPDGRRVIMKAIEPSEVTK